MVGVFDLVKKVRTKFPGVTAQLGVAWEEGEGAEVLFALNHKDLGTDIKRRYHPRGWKWEEGVFTNKDVLKEYGKAFQKWVNEINRKKWVTIWGERIMRKK